MAENPLYEQQIAPPSSTGEIQDNQSLGLIVAKGNADAAVRQGITNTIMAAGGVAQTVGEIFTRKNMLSQEATRANDELEVQQQLIQLESKLSQNTNLYKFWENDAQGNPSEMMQNFEKTLLDEHGLELQGVHRDAFELSVKTMFMKANSDIDIKATEYAYAAISNADATKAQHSIDNPDKENPERSIASKLDEFTYNYQKGIDLGMYAPEGIGEATANHYSQLVNAHYGAITADIQDGTMWQDPTDGEEYLGVDGSLEYLDRQLANEKITPSQHEGLTNNVFKMESDKIARGNPIQDQDTQKGLTKYLTRIEQNDLANIRQDILEDELFLYKTSSTWTKSGDAQTQKSLLALVDNIGNPTDTAKSGSTVNPDFYNTYMNPLWNDVTANAWAARNYESAGVSFEDYVWLRGKGRDSETLATNTEMNNMLDQFFAPDIEAAGDDLVAVNKIESEKILMRGWVESLLARPGMEPADVPQIYSNILQTRIDDQIYKEYIGPDPRRTNPVEMLAHMADTGEGYGSFSSPYMSDALIKVREVHKGIIDLEYGEENYRGSRLGKIGTAAEGQTYFKVFDQNANGGEGAEVWVYARPVMNEKGGMEEVLMQKTELPNADGSDNWVLAETPLINLDDRRAKETENYNSVTAEDMINKGYPWDVLSQQYGEDWMIENYGTDTRIVGGPGYSLPVNKYFNLYQKNADGYKISIEAVNRMMDTQAEGPINEENRYKVYEKINENVHDIIINDINTQRENGKISLVNSRGNATFRARGAISFIIAQYGLPSDYAKIYLDEILAPPELSSGGGL